ncbi:hypothetical protein MTR67_001170 [Solanum verrucosum]|uniref:Uncharacterized protein n=1 Tax=Solanum verrucosum TaxID=315347 RepID=A0AAF0PRC4_SOLVR|nr:hypothetical protein MTR67_001170 [Solanum verrucosum]
MTIRLNGLMKVSFTVMTLAANDVDSEEIARKYLYLTKVEIIKHQSELYVQNHEKNRSKFNSFNDSVSGFFEHHARDFCLTVNFNTTRIHVDLLILILFYQIYTCSYMVFAFKVKIQTIHKKMLIPVKRKFNRTPKHNRFYF